MTEQRATITLTTRSIAELAERSPGYAVTLEGGTEMTEIGFRRTKSGRRDRFVVECLLDGDRGVFCGDTVLRVQD